MPTAPFPLTRDVPEALSAFVHERCHIPADALRIVPPDTLPSRENRLLVHPDDMTSTLATFHGSPLRVELLQREVREDLYLREVYLRTTRGEKIVEYGVIAIALAQFTAAQQQDILAGRTPLGALLHEFEIPFESAPIGFFSVASASASLSSGLRGVAGETLTHPTACYGRFNRLSRRTREPLAWIMEILPPA
jgi:hypothetical protein